MVSANEWHGCHSKSRILIFFLSERENGENSWKVLTQNKHYVVSTSCPLGGQISNFSPFTWFWGIFYLVRFASTGVPKVTHKKFATPLHIVMKKQYPSKNIL